jgi:hypothetical protein
MNHSFVFLSAGTQITAAEKACKEAIEALNNLQTPPEPTETEDQTPQLASFLTSGPNSLESPHLQPAAAR